MNQILKVGFEYIRVVTPTTERISAMTIISKRFNFNYRERFSMQHLLYLSLEKNNQYLNDIRDIAKYDWNSKSRRISLLAYLALNDNKKEKLNLLDYMISSDGDTVLNAAARSHTTGPSFEFIASHSKSGEKLYHIEGLPSIGIKDVKQPILKLTEAQAKIEIQERTQSLNELLSRLEDKTNALTIFQVSKELNQLEIELIEAEEHYPSWYQDEMLSRITADMKSLKTSQLPVVIIRSINSRLSNLESSINYITETRANKIQEHYILTNKEWAKRLRKRVLNNEKFSYIQLYLEGIQLKYLKKQREHYEPVEKEEDKVIPYDIFG